VIDDYGHHPVEIEAVLRAARESTTGQVIAVVQPHRYSRLQTLFELFCTCFNDADSVIVAPVYPAGEAPIAARTVTASWPASGAGASPCAGARWPAAARESGKEHCAPGRLCGVPRGGQHHPVGLRSAGRARGTWSGGVKSRLSSSFGELAQTLYAASTAIEKIEFQSLAMTRSLLSELLELSPAERIQLAQDLWDSIEPEEMPPLTADKSKRWSDGTPSMSAILKLHPGGTTSKRGCCAL